MTVSDKAKRINHLPIPFLKDVQYLDILVGYFRSSGFNLLYSEFEDIEKFLVKLRPNEWATIFAVSQTASDVELSIRWQELF